MRAGFLWKNGRLCATMEVEDMEEIKDGVAREEIAEKVGQLRIIDNIMFQFCAKDNPAFVEHILRPIAKEVFGFQDIHILSVHVEDIVPNAANRGIRLDALAEDEKGRKYAVEMQRGSDAEKLKYRVRFYRALVDSTLLKPGEKFENISEAHVCFLCEKDPRGDGKPFYESWEVWKDNGEPIGDGVSCVYTNGDYRGNDPIGNLNHDLMCEQVDEIYDPVLRSNVQRFKDGGKEEDIMIAELEDLYLRGEQKGIEKGIDLGEDKVYRKLIFRDISERSTISAKTLADRYCIPVSRVEKYREEWKKLKPSEKREYQKEDVGR